ncbi:MAG: type II secretion system protein [Gammaproteobacteria bacterium]
MQLKRVSGFTLIELLFVIAILGALSVTGIVYYQQRMQNQKIEKTVAQIQQWLQAGVAYREDTGEWPEKITDLTDPNKPYIPNPKTAADSNPWCNTKPCFSIGTEGSLFTVSATINAMPAVYQTIAGRLPYAKIISENDTIKVQARVSVPGVENAKQDTILVNIGYVKVYSLPFMYPIGSGAVRTAYSIVPIWANPDCSQYGQDYVLKLYPQIISYAADRVEASQQAGFSLLSVHYVGRHDDTHWVELCMRPQELKKSITGIYSEGTTEDMLKNITALIQVIFVCKKTGTTSNYHNLPKSSMEQCNFNTPISPNSVSPASGIFPRTSHSSEFRF